MTTKNLCETIPRVYLSCRYYGMPKKCQKYKNILHYERLHKFHQLQAVRNVFLYVTWNQEIIIVLFIERCK